MVSIFFQILAHLVFFVVISWTSNTKKILNELIFEIFNTVRFYKSWNIFRNFPFIFQFFEFKYENIEIGRYDRSMPLPAGTTGFHGIPAGSKWFRKPCTESEFSFLSTHQQRS
jgi:hypothetical protein